jgi:Holliday junction resolvase
MKAAGTRRENQVRDLLASEGWVVMRAPASIGAADLIALKDGSTSRFIQVKATAGGPYKTFGPGERRELSQVAKQAGGVAELCWWPPRGACRWVSEQDWPVAP